MNGHEVNKYLTISMNEVCPSVTTHKDQQANLASMKPIKDLIISMKGVCPSVIRINRVSKSV